MHRTPIFCPFQLLKPQKARLPQQAQHMLQREKYAASIIVTARAATIPQNAVLALFFIPLNGHTPKLYFAAFSSNE